MCYEQLSLASFIKEMKEVTDGPHPRKFCFVLGAGASRTSGIKSGQELVKIWDKELQERNEIEYCTWRNALGITDDNMSSFYSQYYEKRFQRCRTDGYNYIEKIMDSAKPSAGYVMLAHLLTKTPHNVIITTNFDHLTEDAVNYYAQSTPLVIGHEALAHYVSGQPVRPTIIKIHRDLLFDPKSRSEDLEKLPDSWKNALELVFSNYHPVFIGYAGNDKSLMDFLVENSDKFAEDEWKFPYWMLYKTDKVEGKVKKFLEKSNGFYVLHGGFDEVMIQLGAAFEYMIPSEESFLGDARKRYKALADAIDALSDGSKSANIVGTSTMFLHTPEDREETEEKTNVDQAIRKIIGQSDMHRMYREAVDLVGENKNDQALEILEQLVKIDPDNPRYQNSYGDVLRKLERYEEALSAYRKSIELEPENDIYYLDLGFVLMLMGENEPAMAEFQKAIEIAPEEEIYHFFAAVVLERMDKKEEALSEYQKAVEINPRSATNHYHLASTLHKVQRNDEALVSIRKAISINSDDPRYYQIMSSILHKLGRLDEAKAAEEAAEMLREEGESDS